MVLRIFAIIALLVAIFYLSKLNKSNPVSFKQAWAMFTKELESILNFKEWKNNFKKIVYLVAIITVALLALTGFIPFLILGTPMAGFALMLHVVLAPIFILCVTLAAIIWAKENSFAELKDDALWTKINFWIILLFAFVLGTMVFSMYPIFGTIGQHALLSFHKFSAIVLFISALFHTLYTVRTISNKADK